MIGIPEILFFIVTLAYIIIQRRVYVSSRRSFEKKSAYSPKVSVIVAAKNE
ncbi:MAG: hypothetical protein ACEPO8_08635 [Rhodothermaceae bacterium]